MDRQQTVIIAEAGVNHNGSLARAKQMIAAARSAEADFIKFQTFKADTLVTARAKKADYQKKRTGAKESQHRMLEKLELDYDAHYELLDECRRQGIGFLSTAFDEATIDFIALLKPEYFKIPSGEITNLPYLRHIGKLGGPLLVSTGMATLKEVEAALCVLQASGTPRERVTVLQCNTDYPTAMADANLRAMLTMRDKLGTSVGYSDHTLGIEVPLAAVALGAAVIEKHFTLDRHLPGPDHGASLEPGELRAMVKGVRNIEAALGDGIKRPSPSEMKNIPVARRSIVTAANIRRGELFTSQNLAVKRPGTGISPMFYDELLGKAAYRDYQADELIDPQVLSKACYE